MVAVPAGVVVDVDGGGGGGCGGGGGGTAGVGVVVVVVAEPPVDLEVGLSPELVIDLPERQTDR